MWRRFIGVPLLVALCFGCAKERDNIANTREELERTHRELQETRWQLKQAREKSEQWKNEFEMVADILRQVHTDRKAMRATALVGLAAGDSGVLSIAAYAHYKRPLIICNFNGPEEPRFP